MVISHSNNFIFLRIPKNASTSVASFLIENCCNKEQDKWTVVNDSGKKNNNITDAQLAPYRQQYRFIHMTLQEIVDQGIISEEQAVSMNNIGIIRDPFERQLSLYFFLTKGMHNRSVQGFRKMFANGYHKTDGRNMIIQSDYFNLNGVDRSNKWWLYDNLQDEVNYFAGKEVTLPGYKTKFTPRTHNLVDEYYDQKTKDAVRKYYEKDFELIDGLRK